MKEKIHIYSGPIIYRNYFLYNNRMFIIDANKNFFFIAFPFLMFLFPIRCYEVERDTVEFSKKRKNTILFPIIAVNSAFLENVVSYMVINVSISPYISIIFAIATAFLIWIRRVLHDRLSLFFIYFISRVNIVLIYSFSHSIYKIMKRFNFIICHII